MLRVRGKRPVTPLGGIPDGTRERSLEQSCTHRETWAARPDATQRRCSLLESPGKPLRKPALSNWGKKDHSFPFYLPRTGKCNQYF